MEVIEYGKLVILKKDGTEGPYFDITKDFTIGRDKNCEIRIKLDCVSRIHSKISIDENGNCVLNHLSKTNPTLINGQSINDCSSLNDGDKISIGDREFIYQQAAKHVNFASIQVSHDESKVNSPVPVIEAIPSVEKVDTKKRLQTPLKNAIKSIKKPEIEEDVAESRLQTIPSSRIMKTPLRKAIQARLLGSAVKSTKASELRRLSSSPRRDIKLLKTPLRKAIESRRISGGSSRTLFSDSTSAAADKTHNVLLPAAISLSSSLKDAIQSRRISFSTLDSNQPIKEIAVDRKQPLESSNTVQTLMSPIRKAIEARKRISISVPTPTKDMKNEKPKSLVSAMKRAIESRRRRSSIGMPSDSNDVDEFHLESAIVSATCAQLSVQAFCNEVQVQEGSTSEVAYAEAVDCFEENPSTFTNMDVDVDEEQLKDNQLALTSEQSFIPYLVTVEEKIELISTMTQEEIGVLEEFSKKIENCEENLDSNMSVSLAFDAYVKGITNYHKKRDSLSQDVECTVVEDLPFLSSSLRDLFKLPADYLTANDDDYDSDMVTSYALEIVNCSGIDEDIAYSIALDTFLADPIFFRNRIGGLALPEISHVGNQNDEEIVEEDAMEIDAAVEEPCSSDATILLQENEAVESMEESVTADEAVESMEESVAPNEAVESMEESVAADEVVESMEESVAPNEAVESMEESVAADEAVESMEESVAADEVVESEKETEMQVEEVDVEAEADVQTANQEAIQINKEEAIAESFESEVQNEFDDSFPSVEIANIDSNNTSIMEVSNTAKTPSRSSIKATAQSTRKSTRKVVLEELPAEITNNSNEGMVQEHNVKTNADINTKTPQRSVSTNPKQCTTRKTPSCSTIQSTRKSTRKIASDLSSQETSDINSEDISETSTKTPIKSNLMQSTRKSSRFTDTNSVQDVDINSAEPAMEIKRTNRRNSNSTEVKSATQTKETKRSSSKKKKEESDQIVVAIVEEAPIEDEEEIIVILCDGCDGEFSMDELGLKEVPEGDWFCSPCEESRNAKSKSTTRGRGKGKGNVAPAILKSETSRPQKRSRKEVEDVEIESKRPTRRVRS